MKEKTDIVLIGAGIMSATLGTLLNQIKPDYKIIVLERQEQAATESSDAWNNAGTGHSAFCELNYTPIKDGKVDISKAISIAEQFEVSKQFWSYLLDKGIITKNFITEIPHMSFIKGEKDVNFLKERYDLLKQNPLFDDMIFSEDPKEIENWIPLMMKDRKRPKTIDYKTGKVSEEKVAATYMSIGTDVNFGKLTREMFQYLSNQDSVSIRFNNEVYNIKKSKDKWVIKTKDILTGEKRKIVTNFVFIGAGGASIHLLEKSGIEEGVGYGGFPVSGQWLRCINPDVIEKHSTKVYGKAQIGAPPMSVPHLDTRYIDGKKELLFGPYAGFSTKFLKNGSYFDLFKSINLYNIATMVSAGLSNVPLTKYLIEQVRQSKSGKINYLREFIPNADPKDWILETAGQRVQVIKKDANGKGILEFGTEVIKSSDGSLAVLLGASPGASTAVSIMIDLIKKCFVEDFTDEFTKIIPSYGKKLNDDKNFCQEIRNKTKNLF